MTSGRQGEASSCLASLEVRKVTGMNKVRNSFCTRDNAKLDYLQLEKGHKVRDWRVQTKVGDEGTLKI